MKERIEEALALKTRCRHFYRPNISSEEPLLYTACFDERTSLPDAALKRLNCSYRHEERSYDQESDQPPTSDRMQPRHVIDCVVCACFHQRRGQGAGQTEWVDVSRARSECSLVQLPKRSNARHSRAGSHPHPLLAWGGGPATRLSPPLQSRKNRLLMRWLGL